MALAVALTVGGAACGGGGKGAPLDAGAKANRDDQTVARDANLAISDFPPEWKSSPVPAETSAANVESNRTLAACMQRPPPEEVRTASADSNDFSSTDTRRVSSSVQLLKAEDIAVGDFAALRSDSSLACHRAQIEAEFRRQLPTATPQLSMDRLALPQFGDETVAFRADATSQAQGIEVRTFIDLVFVRKGRAELSASFINRTSPFPTELQSSLLQRMVGRA